MKRSVEVAGLGIMLTLAAGCGEILGLPDGEPRTECVPGTRQCSVNTPQECNSNGLWQNADPCFPNEPRCDTGTCTIARSCTSLPETCGPNEDENCCLVNAVPGGSYNRSNDPAFIATVSPFWLDRFEVTVGRFRKFVEAYPKSKPAPGAGAHPLIAQSGWDPSWDENLPPDQEALRSSLVAQFLGGVWTDTVDARENLPMNNVSWYVAFAFCAWDGGRLPTEAEWNYAAAGGSYQYEYPWSSGIDETYAVYNCLGDGVSGCSSEYPGDYPRVGSRSPKGDGVWADADMAGSVAEWTFDGYGAYIPDCFDCANTRNTLERVYRGGAWIDEAPSLRSSVRNYVAPSAAGLIVGVRCARTP